MECYLGELVILKMEQFIRAVYVFVKDRFHGVNTTV
jgi:hypothetical protein